MSFSRISSSLNVCHSMLILAASFNQHKGKVPWHPYQLYLFANWKTFRDYSVVGKDSSVNMHHDSQRTYQVVVAATRDMGIGKNDKLPWKLPSDLMFFKEITMSTSDPAKKNAVIMGRKTWESIPLQYRPLPGRLNVVLTHSMIATSDNIITCGSIPSALELLANSPYSLEIEKVFVIGGGQILREAMNGPWCEAIHMTEIDANVDCDTFIPSVDISVFRPWYSSSPVTENDICYRFVSYVRVRNSSDSYKSEVEDFSFLPKMIFDKREKFMYIKLVNEINFKWRGVVGELLWINKRRVFEDQPPKGRCHVKQGSCYRLIGA